MSSIPNPITTNWVPLQGDSRERTRYWGTYESSRIYNDGDCAIGVDGVLYLCTKNGTITAPTTWPKSSGLRGLPGPQGPQGLGMPAPVVEGQWLKGVGGAAVWSSPAVSDVLNIAAVPSYGTALPTLPIDGQEHILVDNWTAPTWSWRCRYNATATGAYKWEVAGCPIFAPIMGSQLQIAAGVWTALSASTIRVPRSGMYICQLSCRTLNNGGAGNYNYFALSLNGAANYFGPIPVYTSGSGLWGSPYIGPFQYPFNLGDLVGVTGYGTAAPAYYDQITWSIKPARIS